VKQREPGISEKRAKLVALIEHLDSGIGKVLDTLDRTGSATNTLVIFTSDNGGVLANEANNGPWRGGKQHMYEGGLRVPGAARYPGRIQAGSRTERITLTMDIFATACAALGVPVPKDIDGVSFLPTLLGQPEPELKRDFYFVRREGGDLYGGKTIEAFRRGDWKLVQDSPFAPLELYDLKDDPRETTDLAKGEPQIFKQLSAGLREQIQRGGHAPWQPPPRTQ
jgi:arylsulfatase A-like enzyme